MAVAHLQACLDGSSDVLDWAVCSTTAVLVASARCGEAHCLANLPCETVQEISRFFDSPDAVMTGGLAVWGGQWALARAATDECSVLVPKGVRNAKAKVLVLKLLPQGFAAAICRGGAHAAVTRMERALRGEAAA